MSEQANTTAAAEVSSEYLSDIRLRVRSSVDKLDGEIKDLILAARADLEMEQAQRVVEILKAEFE